MKILVIGMGKSGQGAARFLLKEGHNVIGYDQNSFKLEGVSPLKKEEQGFDLVILSSGIPKQHQEAQRSCPVIGEAELALRYMKNQCIGITGTNGKTTLTLLITHILNFSGIKARALGNIGESLCEYLIKPDLEEIIIAELSSFQLEMMDKSILEHGVILNITPDHLDRYQSFEEYTQVKLSIENLVKKNLIVTEDVAKLLSSKKLEVVNFDSYLQLTKKERYCQILGYDKVMCAFAICKKFNVTWNHFKEGIKTFKKPEHRLEYIGEVNNIHFFNDSKGTNVEATMYAVNQIKGPIWLIAGGKNKNRSFEKWKEVLPRKVKKIFAIGEAAEQIENELSKALSVKRYPTLRQAVKRAFQEAVPGGTVLLSPGCASWDQFLNYKERGKIFKKCVFELNR